MKFGILSLLAVFVIWLILGFFLLAPISLGANSFWIRVDGESIQCVWFQVDMAGNEIRYKTTSEGMIGIHIVQDWSTFKAWTMVEKEIRS